MITPKEDWQRNLEVRSSQRKRSNPNATADGNYRRIVLSFFFFSGLRQRQRQTPGDKVPQFRSASTYAERIKCDASCPSASCPKPISSVPSELFERFLSLSRIPLPRNYNPGQKTAWYLMDGLCSFPLLPRFVPLLLYGILRNPCCVYVFVPRLVVGSRSGVYPTEMQPNSQLHFTPCNRLRSQGALLLVSWCALQLAKLVQSVYRRLLNIQCQWVSLSSFSLNLALN